MLRQAEAREGSLSSQDVFDTVERADPESAEKTEDAEEEAEDDIDDWYGCDCPSDVCFMAVWVEIAFGNLKSKLMLEDTTPPNQSPSYEIVVKD